MNQPLILLSEADNVLVAIREIARGEPIRIDGTIFHPAQAIPLGHKLARCALLAGDRVIKLGVPIGVLTVNVAAGDLVHSHNLASLYLRARRENPKRSQNDD